MIRTIIIDDEQHCIDRLSGLLNTQFTNSIGLLGAFSSVPEGFKAVKQLQPDLVFLDVQIHQQTGFDLLRELGRIDFEVIFTTAFEKFAVRAFKFSALDYLLKPVDEDDLRQAISKFSERSRVTERQQQYDVLLTNTREQRQQPGRILIPTTSGFEVVSVNDIFRLQSDVNYTTIFMKSGQKMVVAKTLKEFEEMLAEHDFFRLHNSHLVNLASVRSYNKGKGGSVVLTDGTELEVSTRRKEEFLKRLTQR